MFLVLLTVSVGSWAAITVSAISETFGYQGATYQGYSISGWENEGDIAAFLDGTYSGTINWPNDVNLNTLKSADLIRIGSGASGESLGDADLQSFDKLTACKFLDLDKASLASDATVSNIKTGSNILTVTLPSGLTKDNVNAVATKLKTYNGDFHSVISIGTDVETEEVETYFIADQNGNATSEEYTGQRFNDDTQGTVQRPVDFTVTRLDELTEIEYSWTNPATNQKEVLTDWDETTYNDNNGKYTPANLTKSVTKQTNSNNGCYGYYDADGKYISAYESNITTQDVDGTTKYYFQTNWRWDSELQQNVCDLVEVTRCESPVWTYSENGTTYVVSSNDVTNITPNQYNQNEGTLSVPNTGGVSFDVNRKYTYTYSYYDDYDQTTYTYTSENPSETTKTVQKTIYVNIVKGTKEVTSSEIKAIAYVNTAGTLYEATCLSEAKTTNPATKIVLSGNLDLGDLCIGGDQSADPISYSDAYKEGTYNETVDAAHGAWDWGNKFTSIDLSGVESIENYRYLRQIGKYNQTLEELILSPKIAHLPEAMLYSSQKLKNLVIPEGVTTIGRYAFQEGHMEYVSIPSTIQMIGTGAFDKCKQLYYLDFAEGIEHLNFESGVFTECEGLKHVALPEGLLSIGDETFIRCTGLRSVRLPSTLTDIGDGAFALCSKLTSITIPKSVQNIGKNAFPDELKDVYLMATSIAELPKIWTAGAVSAGDAIQNGNSTFGAANLVNNNTNNSQGASALSGMTWDEACDDYYATNKMAALHFPNDFNRDELENAFRISLTESYSEQRTTTDGIKVPDLNHGWSDDGITEYFNTTIPTGCSDLDRRIRAAEPDPTDPSLSVLSKTGWRQFALIKGYAKDGTEHELEKYYKQVWYTMCFPFNLTDELLTDAFGAGFNICEFSGVTADYVVNDEGENESTLILHFTQSTSDQETGYLADAFHPYMIHPNYKSRDVTKVYSALFHDIYPIAVDEGTNNPQSHSVTKTVEVDVDGERKIGNYTFIGNVGPKTKIPYGAYFLGTAPGDTYPKYWRETSETNTAWSQYAAIVLADAEFEKTLFGIEGDNWVKSFNFIMDGYESPDGEALSIDNVIADAKEKNIPVKYMNIVYDFNGQIVRKGDASLENLPTGMYIVNGKKYLVK